MRHPLPSAAAGRGLLSFLLMSATAAPARAAGEEAEEPAPAEVDDDEPEPDPKKKGPKSPFLEVGLTTSQTFRGEYLGNYEDEIEMTPTGTLLLGVEFMPLPWLRPGVVYNLPTAPERITINGELQQTVATSQILMGVTWRPIYFDFAKKSRFEILALTYVGVQMKADPLVFPMVGVELEGLPNKTSGLAVHVGAFYSFLVDGFAIRYGVAYRF